MKYSKDADMGSDHKCVMAAFVFNTPKEDGPCRTKIDRLEKTRQNIRKQADKKTVKKDPFFEKRYQEIIEKIKEKAEAANTESRKREEKNR